MLRILSIFLLAAACISCREKFDEKAVIILDGIPLEQKIGQMLMLSVPGRSINEQAMTIIEKCYPGGIILFGYNIGKEEESKKYIHDLQNAACGKYGIPLFISTDQEGGRVKRIADGVTQFPGAMSFGIINDKTVTYDSARILGIELRRMGVNINLAPDLDVNNNPENPVINTRSYGSDPDIVSAMGKAYIKAMRKSMCIAVAKHFPGHGDTNKDSHKILPVIKHNMDKLREVELTPFKTAIKNSVDAVMTAHISFPNILHNNEPATISGRFLNDLLRNEMQFQGIVITDDLEMKAVSGKMNIGEAAVKAVLAGADIILVSSYNDTSREIHEALMDAVKSGDISVGRVNNSVKRIIELKLRYRIMKFENGSVSFNEIIFSENDLRILKKANKLNIDVSRGSIYYYSDKEEIIKYSNTDRNIFLSSGKIFIKYIDYELGRETYKLFRKFNDCVKYIKSMNIHLPENIKIFYQFNNPDKEKITKLDELCKTEGINLILLCTGNPFLMNDLPEMHPALFTFSNTDESIHQLVLCLKGEFTPKREINVNLGFNKINN